MTKQLQASNGKTIFIDKYDEFDWFQLMSLDLDDPSYEDDKEVMRLD